MFEDTVILQYHSRNFMIRPYIRRWWDSDIMHHWDNTSVSVSRYQQYSPMTRLKQLLNRCLYNIHDVFCATYLLRDMTNSTMNSSSAPCHPHACKPKNERRGGEGQERQTTIRGGVSIQKSALTCTLKTSSLNLLTFHKKYLICFMTK